MQIKAGLKKEWIYFAKSFRMTGVFIAMLLFSLSSPLMMKATDFLLDKTFEIQDVQSTEQTESSDEVATFNCPECGHEITANEYTAGIMANTANKDGETISDYIEGFNTVNYGLSMVLSGLSSSAILVLLLCMMSAAGGEQKKRNVIIPNCSGLTTWGYILPKFIFYPVFTFLSTASISYLGYWMCTALYNSTIPAVDLLNFIMCNSLFCTFIVILYLFAGLSTGKAGISVVIVYLFLQIFPTVLEYAEVNEYNPFSLMKYAYGGNMTVDWREELISMSMTVAISIFFMILTYLFVNIRKIDNTRKVEVKDVSNN